MIYNSSNLELQQTLDTKFDDFWKHSILVINDYDQLPIEDREKFVNTVRKSIYYLHGIDILKYIPALFEIGWDIDAISNSLKKSSIYDDLTCKDTEETVNNIVYQISLIAFKLLDDISYDHMQYIVHLYDRIKPKLNYFDIVYEFDENSYMLTLKLIPKIEGIDTNSLSKMTLEDVIKLTAQNDTNHMYIDVYDAMMEEMKYYQYIHCY